MERKTSKTRPKHSPTKIASNRLLPRSRGRIKGMSPKVPEERGNDLFREFN
ncbi:hypothetical protein BS47DRAFT_1340375 [Hydnum rufescens UP504]|uniref:Uncharacterized protein n=1 Tax=Hydnum rufescens UP504 TaxID=1448309 RepID=A0A9P6B4D8_9AGAM|nr:hypothetical protein BS47DRAFT_1340375 [Hydnum rufescens UP504]